MRKETFVPYAKSSLPSVRASEDLLAKRKPIEGRKKRRQPGELIEEEDTQPLFLEVLVITASMILITTSAVLLIFSGYLQCNQYGMTLTFDFLTSVILQFIASLFLGATAVLTCTCKNPDYVKVPILCKSAIVFLVLSILVLIAEIIMSLLHRFLNHENLFAIMEKTLKDAINNPKSLKVWESMQEQLKCCGIHSRDDWFKYGMATVPKSCCNKFKGKKCVKWWKQGCQKAYMKMKTDLLSYLTGSAGIALANCIIILPVLIKLLLVSKKLIVLSDVSVTVKKYLRSSEGLESEEELVYNDSYITLDSKRSINVLRSINKSAYKMDNEIPSSSKK